MKYLNIPIPKELNEKLDLHCRDEGMLKKKVVELAIQQYLKNKEDHETNSV